MGASSQNYVPCLCSHPVAQAGLDSHYITQVGIEHACLSLPSAETTGITHHALLPHALFLESACAHPPPKIGHAHQCISTIPDVQMQAFSKSRRSDSASAHAHMRSPRPLPGRASLHAATLGTACARDLPARGLALLTKCVRARARSSAQPGVGPRSPAPSRVTQHLWLPGIFRTARLPSFPSPASRLPLAHSTRPLTPYSQPTIPQSPLSGRL